MRLAPSSFDSWASCPELQEPEALHQVSGVDDWPLLFCSRMQHSPVLHAAQHSAPPTPPNQHVRAIRAAHPSFWKCLSSKFMGCCEDLSPLACSQQWTMED
jgi:hypothetical protein